MADEPDERWDVVDGLRLYSRVLGARETVRPGPAPPVVLVHGLGMSSRYMEPLLHRLSARYRVYAPDLPGIGRSDAPPQLLGPAQRAGVLRGWMRVVGLERPALLAHSAGCEVARQVAEQDADRVSCLILVSPAPDPSRRHIPQQASRLLLDGFREAPSLLLLAVRDYTDAGPRRMLHIVRTALHHNRHLRRATRTGAADRRIAPPTLVVLGQRDPVVSQQWARTVAGLATEGTLVTVPDAPHALNYTAAPALADVVEPFLSRHLPG